MEVPLVGWWEKGGLSRRKYRPCCWFPQADCSVVWRYCRVISDSKLANSRDSTWERRSILRFRSAASANWASRRRAVDSVVESERLKARLGAWNQSEPTCFLLTFLHVLVRFVALQQYPIKKYEYKINNAPYFWCSSTRYARVPFKKVRVGPTVPCEPIDANNHSKTKGHYPVGPLFSEPCSTRRRPPRFAPGRPPTGPRTPPRGSP